MTSSKLNGCNEIGSASGKLLFTRNLLDRLGERGLLDGCDDREGFLEAVEWCLTRFLPDGTVRSSFF